MKVARFEWNGAVRYGVLQGETLFSLVGDLFGEYNVGELVCSIGEARLLAPVVPGKVVAVGLNYAAHVTETVPDRAIPEEPVIFMKPPSAVVGPLEPVIYPKMSSAVSYEAELVVVIGKRAKNVSEAEARGYVLGYTCGNDVTARDLQRKDGQWTRSKGFDTFCPLGPIINTELDPANLRIRSRVNGEPRQDSTTANLLNSVDKLISFISQVMPLLPGDVIMTGTPEGVGLVNPGDVMEVEIEGIGVLRNPVSAL